MVEMVREMHDKSGLTEAVRASTVTLADAEDMVLDVRHGPCQGSADGSAVRELDRHGPGVPGPAHAAFDAHLHYRMIDVSSIKELCRRWYPRTYFGQPAKGLAHRALADIQESIRELEYYRRTLFVPQPGPDVDAARAIATVHRSAAHRLIKRAPVHIPVAAGTWYALSLSSRAIGPCRRRAHGGRSSAGRAPGCGPGCRGFKSLLVTPPAPP